MAGIAVECQLSWDYSCRPGVDLSPARASAKTHAKRNGNRETINRIVRSNQVQLYIEELRQSYIALGREAINAMRKNFESADDGRLARQVLADIGAVPSARERDVLLSGDSRSGNLALDLLRDLKESSAENGQDDEQDDPDDEQDGTPE